MPSATATDYFNGTIDEVKIFNRMLSTAEVLAEYQSMPTTTTTTVPSTTTTTTTASSTTTTTQPPPISFATFSFYTTPTPGQMNVIWSTEYSGGTSVDVECELNGAAVCSYIGHETGGGSCTMLTPVYLTAPEGPNIPHTVLNTLSCTAWDPDSPGSTTEKTVTFFPRAIGIAMPADMATTVGDELDFLLTIKNNGTFTDSYNIDVTTSDQILQIENEYQTTQGLDTNDVQQIHVEMLLLSTGSANAQVQVSSDSDPAIYYLVTIPVRGTQKSLPEFDAWGLLQLVLAAAALASFLF
jgi:hypothetical protein